MPLASWASALTTRSQRLTVQSYVSRSLHPSDYLGKCTLQPSIFLARSIGSTHTVPSPVKAIHYMVQQ